jgi:hypothetical protein
MVQPSLSNVIVGGAAEPGLDGDGKAGVEFHAAAGAAVVGDVQGLVHGAAYAVAAELGVDAVAMGVGNLADRGRDVAEAAAGLGGGDAGLQCDLGGFDQLQVGRVGDADDDGERGVGDQPSMPAAMSMLSRSPSHKT